MKISELAEAPFPNDEALVVYKFIDGQPCRYMPIGEYLRRYKPVYTHRNGETEAPTEPGAYWFKGDFYHGRVGDKKARHPEQLLIQVEQAIHGLKFDEFACDVGRDPKHFAGQWWGPITPPWETSE